MYRHSASARALALGGTLMVTGIVGCNTPDATSPGASLDRFATGVNASMQQTLNLGVGDTASIQSPLATWATREAVKVTWSSSDKKTLKVSKNGLATAVAAGNAHVIVKASKFTDSIPVSVGATQVASINLTAPAGGVAAGSSGQLGVTVLDANGNVLTGRPLSFSSSDPSVATVNSSGLVNGQSAGNVTVSARSGSTTGSVALTVAQGSGGGGGGVSLPALPQTFTVKYPAVTGTSWVLKPNDNLQNAINKAQRGDEIVLPAGATYVGNFALPNKGGNASNGWITIRSDKLNQLPAGNRVTPAKTSLMPKIQSPNQTAALYTVGAATGWYVAGVEVTNSSTWTKQAYAILQLGDGGNKQFQLSQVPSDLVFDRVYAHGAPTSNLSRCVALNSGRTAIIDSYLGDCHGRNFDAQAIAGWNGPGPYQIVNNTIIGSGENIMFGGSDPKIGNLVPSDVEIRRNYVYTPASWKKVWMKKNLLETKNVQRMLIEGNVFDGAWADGQTGFAFMLKSANQSGRCTWCMSRDITIRQNIIRNVGAGFNLAGREGSNKHKVGQLLNHVLIEENIVENVNVGPYLGDARMLQFIQNPSDVTIRNNTMSTSGNLLTFMTLGTTPAATDIDVRDNIFEHGSYGLFSSNWGVGEVSLQGFRGKVTFQSITMISKQRNGYPHGTFVPNLSAALGTGNGANQNAVQSATQGVIIP